jgi:integrase
MGRYKQSYSLYKRGKYYYYRTYGHNGARTTGKTTGCSAKGAAVAFCDELFKSGQLLCGNGNTFGKYASGFFDDGSTWVEYRKASRGISVHTLKLYRLFLKVHIMPQFAAVKINDINFTALISFRQVLINKQLSNRTVNLVMSILHNIMSCALRDNIIIRNPFEGFERLQVQKKARDAFTLEEVKTVLQKTEGTMHDYILFLTATGMRAAEALGVSKNDLREDSGLKYIRLEKQFYNNDFHDLKTKTAREVPVCARVVKLLAAEDGRAFPLGYSYYSKTFSNLVEDFDDCKDRKLSLHSLRHFFTMKVEAITGHAVEKGIGEVYTNFKASDLSEIIEWQDWFIDSVTTPRN